MEDVKIFVAVSEPDCGDPRDNGTVSVERPGTPGGEYMTRSEIDYLTDELGYDFSFASVIEAEEILKNHECEPEGPCDPTSGTCVFDMMSYQDIVSMR